MTETVQLAVVAALASIVPSVLTALVLARQRSIDQLIRRVIKEAKAKSRREALRGNGEKHSRPSGQEPAAAVPPATTPTP